MKRRLVGIAVALVSLAWAVPGMAAGQGDGAAQALQQAYPVELPPAAQARAAIEDAPDVNAAAALLDAAQAERRRLAAGPHEWSTRADYQRRRVHAAGVNEGFNEWAVSLERGVRLPGKAELDRRLGTERFAEAAIALGDAKHEASRRLLELWYAMLRERRSAQLLSRQADLAAREASAVARRRELGDASRLDEVQAAAEAEQAEAARRAAANLAERAAITLVREFPLLGASASPQGVPQRWPGPLPESLPESLPEPSEPVEDPAELAREALAGNHALRAAQAAATSAHTEALRALADRRADPTVGVQYGSERSAEERVLGVFVSIPFGGEARRAAADASVARASALERRAEAQRRQVDAQLAALLSAARSGVSRWQAAQRGAELQASAAERVARARELGEADFAEMLRARRLALDAALRAETVRVDALEARARLLLDAHRLWEFEGEAQVARSTPGR